MDNKRGQGLSTNAIILIILGVIILVILILGFTLGWNKILPFIKPGNNINDVVQACSIACSTSNVYDFCTSERELKAGDLPLGDDGQEQKSVKSTCEFFSTNVGYSKYGIAACTGLCVS